MSIAIKRVYEPAAEADGHRVLVDRVWPRGMKKADVALDEWLKELAPSTALRKWFAHEPARWDGFRHRYAAELDALSEQWRPLAERAAHQTVTLLYGARDEEHNQAVVLQAYLRGWMRSHGPR